MSFTNLIYLLICSPLNSKGTNWTESFNEGCNYITTMIMIILCNPPNISIQSKEITGWFFIAIVCLSIFINMKRNLVGSICACYMKFKQWNLYRTELAKLKANFNQRESRFASFFPEKFKHF